MPSARLPTPCSPTFCKDVFATMLNWRRSCVPTVISAPPESLFDFVHVHVLRHEVPPPRPDRVVSDVVHHATDRRVADGEIPIQHLRDLLGVLDDFHVVPES